MHLRASQQVDYWVLWNFQVRAFVYAYVRYASKVIAPSLLHRVKL